MYMQLNVEKLKQQRERRAWTQSHLAEIADVSLRTIQRIEKSGFASPESTQAICAAFELSVSDLLANANEAREQSTAQPLVEHKANKSAVLIATALAFIVAFVLSYLLA